MLPGLACITSLQISLDTLFTTPKVSRAWLVLGTRTTESAISFQVRDQAGVSWGLGKAVLLLTGNAELREILG